VSPVERGVRGSGRSQIIRRRESLVLYKSFNTLWAQPMLTISVRHQMSLYCTVQYHLFWVDFNSYQNNHIKQSETIVWKTHFEYGSNTPEFTFFILQKFMDEIFLGSIPASSDTVNSEVRKMEQRWKKVLPVFAKRSQTWTRLLDAERVTRKSKAYSQVEQFTKPTECPTQPWRMIDANRV
jgi:hypothetical protein